MLKEKSLKIRTEKTYKHDNMWLVTVYILDGVDVLASKSHEVVGSEDAVDQIASRMAESLMDGLGDKRYEEVEDEILSDERRSI